MNKTLHISFSLKNTYRVNSILYALKQVPLVKKLLPDALYQVRGLKVFANVLSVFWEIGSIFLGKLIYLAVMVAGPSLLYPESLQAQAFLHILLVLSVIGAMINTDMFHPSKDKYYALVLLRMDAREYTLVHYIYTMLKGIVGFIPFLVLFGTAKGIPLWICILIPFSIAGMKMTAAAWFLWEYEKKKKVKNENRLNKLIWLAIVLLLAAAYLPPAFGLVFCVSVYAGIFGISAVCGLLSLFKIFHFCDYSAMCRGILADSARQMDQAKKSSGGADQKMISADTSIVSGKKGFEYLNELFVKRHKRILWKASKRIAVICGILFVGMFAAVWFWPWFQEKTNMVIMTFLPYFVFVMYAINRGTSFTRALFMNCDHSLLTYPFYKQPAMVLQLFWIRLRELIRINLLPAVMIGTGLTGLLWFSGGTDHPLNYGIIFVSIICMSIFFSVHYLVMYYLLQPYNVQTEIKSAAYQIVLTVTYLVCFYMTKLKLATPLFGLAAIVFCILYCAIACMLIYKLAPRTFRLRM